MFCSFREWHADIAFREKPARFGYDRGDVPNLAFHALRASARSSHVRGRGPVGTGVPDGSRLCTGHNLRDERLSHRRSSYARASWGVPCSSSRTSVTSRFRSSARSSVRATTWPGSTTAARCSTRWVERTVDVVILDLSLPDMDGLDVCRALRASGYDGAIMIVTARTGELDRVVGLDSGADDYLTKPFGLAELQARVRALFRRTRRARRLRPRPRPRVCGSMSRPAGSTPARSRSS